jgi:hypothetical protein
VTLITGPSDVPILPGLNLLRVEVTVERRDAVERALPGSDALIEDRAGLSDRVEVLLHGR